MLEDTWEANARYAMPEHLVREMAAVPAPLPGLRNVSYDGSAPGFRDALSREMAVADLPGATAQQLLLAAGEVPFMLTARACEGVFRVPSSPMSKVVTPPE